MQFEINSRKYIVDEFGAIVQTDHRPFVYDAKYSDTYNLPAYKQGNDILQALRLGFATAAHQRKISSIMDVGYGNGAFIEFALKHIPNVYGFDITGVPLLNGAHKMPEFIKADVYTFWDVLEHFSSLDFLSHLDTETICVSLPYCHFLTRGLDWMKTQYKHLKPDEHIRHFNRFSLKLTMQHYGWREVAYSTHEDIIRKSAHDDANILTMAFRRQ